MLASAYADSAPERRIKNPARMMTKTGAMAAKSGATVAKDMEDC